MRSQTLPARRRRRHSVVADSFMMFMHWMNDKMIHRNTQMACCIFSFVTYLVSSKFLIEVKPFKVLQHRPTLLSIVIMALWPGLVAYIRLCRFIESKFWGLETRKGRAIRPLIETLMTAFLAWACGELTNQLEGNDALVGVILAFISISLAEIWLVQELDLFLADFVFTVLLGVACFKFKNLWFTVIAVSLLCAHRGVLFFMKLEAKDRHQAEAGGAAPAVQAGGAAPTAAPALQAAAAPGIAFEPTELRRLCLEAEESLESKEFYNTADFVAFTALTDYIRTRVVPEVALPPALALDVEPTPALALDVEPIPALALDD